MKTFQSGFTIVFGGPEFVPDEFLRNSSLPFDTYRVIHRGAILSDGQPATESWIDFADIYDGKYPSDAGREAVDFLASHFEEFVRLSGFPGVITRTLNFFGDADSCSMELDPSHIALLHQLSLYISISASNQETANG